MKTLSTQLSGAQLGITVTNLGIGSLAEPAIAALIVGPPTDAGLSPVAARSTSITLAWVLATGLTMIFGELVTENLAIAKPPATARAVVGFRRGFTTVPGWPLRLFNNNANKIVRALGVEPQEELASTRSPEELAGLVRHSANRGALASRTVELVDLMDVLRTGALQLTLLVDEFGDIAGLATPEDLVGEVRDEHDPQDEPHAEQHDDVWAFSSALRPDEAGGYLAATVPEHEDYETPAGLITLNLGRLAEVGDTVTVESDPDPGEEPRLITFEVTDSDEHRITELTARVHELPSEDETEHENREHNAKATDHPEAAGGVELEENRRMTSPGCCSPCCRWRAIPSSWARNSP